MTSERKIAANRKNAKKSTGPRSNAGRAGVGALYRAAMRCAMAWR